MIDQGKFTNFLKSLRNQLPLAFIGVTLISVFVVIVAVLLQIRATLETQKGRDFLTQAQLNSNRLAEQIESQVFRLEGLGDEYSLFNQVSFAQKELDEKSSQERAAYMQEEEERWHDSEQEFFRRSATFLPASVELRTITADNFGDFAGILVTDIYGGLAAVAGELPDQFYYGDEEWWQQIMSGESSVLVGQPYLADDGETVLMDVAVPLLSPLTTEVGANLLDDDRTNDIQGVIRGQLRLSNFSLFEEGALGSTDIEFALIDNTTGTWLYSSTNKDKVGTPVAKAVLDNIEEFPLNWGVDPDETGQELIHSHAMLRAPENQPYLDQLDITIIMQQPLATGVVSLVAFIRPIIIGGLIALAVASVIGYFIARQISRPIISLTNTAVSMAGGQLEQSAPEVGAIELRQLAASFNQLTEQLRQMVTGLEQRVEARTHRLEIVASLGERLGSILDPDELLAEVVNQIQNNFGYYHAHIYLLDDERQNLVVAAGTGSAGAEMKAQQHGIPLNAATSLVARAARSKEIVWEDDVRQTPDWLPNPLLPDTYAEMAVPITLEGTVVGVLDVQENQIAGLDQGDAALLRSLANQVAVAINNARLFGEVQTALANARAVQQRYVEQAWDKNIVARRGTSRVQFSLGESTTLNEDVLAQARSQAVSHSEPSLVYIGEDNEVVVERAVGGEQNILPAHLGKADRALVAPIKLGDTAIGNLQLYEAGHRREWSEADIAFINAIVDQVAQTAENLRLLSETQERASRERLIGQVSDRLRRAPDMQSLMQTAVSELSRVLDPDRAFVKFGSAEELGFADNGDGKNEETVIEQEVIPEPPGHNENDEDADDSPVSDDVEMTVQYPDNGTTTENGSGR